MARQSSRSMWTAKLAGKSVKAAESAALVPGQKVACDGWVLGVDPSLRGTGLAVVEFRPGKRGVLHHSETIKNHPKVSMIECLGRIGQVVTDVLDAWPVEQVAVEQTIYVQNFQTAQILGAARGAVIGPIAMRNLSVMEYAPLRIKQAVVGYGRASKDQVSAMVKGQLDLKVLLPSDESDAAAVAICHAMSLRE